MRVDYFPQGPTNCKTPSCCVFLFLGKNERRAFSEFPIRKASHVVPREVMSAACRTPQTRPQFHGAPDLCVKVIRGSRSLLLYFAQVPPGCVPLERFHPLEIEGGDPWKFFFVLVSCLPLVGNTRTMETGDPPAEQQSRVEQVHDCFVVSCSLAPRCSGAVVCGCKPAEQS